MDVGDHGDGGVADIAAAIGEPVRARMLYCLMDGHARTSTELSAVAEISASTVRAARLVKVVAQGRHRYYGLAGPEVAAVLESLNVLAGGQHSAFAPSTPPRLRMARTCYDHLAGAVGVALHDRLQALAWLAPTGSAAPAAYELTAQGAEVFAALGVDVASVRAQRRRFACACLDWSERRPHLGGALGAALLGVALRRNWLTQDLDSRALSLTSLGRRELASRFGAVV